MAANELERLSELQSYNILDTPSEREFDDIVDLAAYIGGAPISYIGFLDGVRQWFKAARGFHPEPVPQEQTYCRFVVRSSAPVVIPDTREDLQRRPPDGVARIVPSGQEEPREVRFYVGVPILSDSSHVLGTLCVVDFVPRRMVPEHLVPMMERLARQVSGQLQLRRANAWLYEERDTFSTLFEAAPAPLILARDDEIVRVNWAFASMTTDHDSSWVEGQAVSTFLDTDESGHDRPYESVVRTEFGQEIPVLVYTTALRTGQRTYRLIAIADIGDRKEKERVLREQRVKAENANRIKDTFLSLVSHDLKSPLSGIFTMLDLLARGGDVFSDEERHKTILDMRSSAAVLVEMINQLLNIHRLQSGNVEIHPEPFDVKRSTEQILLTLRNQADEKDLILDVDMPDGYQLVADPGLAREAIFNLISNAVKFSPTGGRLRVVVDGTTIAVEDEGPGVPADVREDLFRHEVKTTLPAPSGERGTGLGLPLVADIMEAHGGSVTLDASYDRGARFVLWFPPVVNEASGTDKGYF